MPDSCRPLLMRLFKALRHRDFRIYYGGQLVSITGTWMQNVAQAWLIYRLTGSSAMLGLTAFAGLVPVLLLGLPAGVLADRFPRKPLMMAAQLLAMSQAFTLAALTLSGHVETWHVVALALLLGVVHALELPARHSFLPQLVDREDLPNAIALNSSIFNLARFAGPAIAGVLVALLDEGYVFLINGVTFLIMLLCLTAIRPRPTRTPGGKPRSLGFALRHAAQHPRIRAALLLLGTTSLVSTSYSVLMPVFASEVFQGGAEILGVLLGSAGAGALVAALHLAWLSGRQRLDHHIGGAAITAGAGMIGFSLTPWVGLAVPLLALVGFALTTLVASVNTLIQMLVPDALRGRIMALFSVLFIGATSLGNLTAGWIAEYIGASDTVFGFGMVVVAGGVLHRLFARRLGDETTARASDHSSAGDSD